MNQYLVSYAFDNGFGVQIRDAVLSAATLDQKTINIMREHLRRKRKHYTPVSIIAITKLES